MMGRLMGLVAKLLAVVGVAAIARPRDADEAAVRADTTLTPQERRAATRLPSPAEAAAAHERATHSPPPPGWSRPKPESTPEPSYWPFVLALGTMFFAWGLISNLFLFFGGLLLLLIAVVGWIGDLLHEFS